MKHLIVYEDYTAWPMEDVMKEATRIEIREALIEVLQEKEIKDDKISVDFSDKDVEEGLGKHINTLKKALRDMEFQEQLSSSGWVTSRLNGTDLTILLNFFYKDDWSSKTFVHWVVIQGMSKAGDLYLYVGNVESLQERMHEKLGRKVNMRRNQKTFKKFGI